MFKREWTMFGILTACTVGLTLFARLYTRADGSRVQWLTYVAVVAIVATVAFLALMVYLQAKYKFNYLLARNHIVAQKQYEWSKQKLCIDFDSQRLANTYIATRPVILFSEIAGFRLETYRVGEFERLDEDQVFLSLVLTIIKQGHEFEYQYLPVFEVKVDANDAQDIKEITSDLAEKYPELKDVLELQQDVKKILEINLANGIRYNIQNN